MHLGSAFSLVFIGQALVSCGLWNAMLLHCMCANEMDVVRWKDVV